MVYTENFSAVRVKISSITSTKWLNCVDIKKYKMAKRMIVN